MKKESTISNKRYNVVRVYKLGTEYKIVAFKHSLVDVGTIHRKSVTKKQTKTDSNIIRAKSRIFELAMCNEWDFFGTFTINADKYNRADLKMFYKHFSKFINNWSYRKGKIFYLLIPELHKDGENWHMHGLIKGLKREDLSRFVKGLHPDKLVKGNFLNWSAYSEKFGFCSLASVRNHEAVSKYITKYITKELLSQSIKVGYHLYYVSHGLKGRELMIDCMLSDSDVFDFDYENEYVKIKSITEKEVDSVLEYMQLETIGTLNIF